MRWIIALVFAFRLQAAPERLPVVAPAAWTASEVSGSQVFTPNGLEAGASYQILATPSGEGSESLPQILSAASNTIGQGKPLNSASAPQGGTSRGGWNFSFIHVSFTRDQKIVYASVAGVKKTNRLAFVFGIADSLKTLQRFEGDFKNFLNSIGDEPAAVDVNLTGAFFGLDRGLSASAAGTTIRDSGAVYVFFADGTFRYGFPALGLPTNLAADRGTTPGRWGTWIASGAQWNTRREGYVKNFLIVDGATLKDVDRDRTWQKITPFAQGQRLEGTFLRAENLREPNSPRIQFRRDGTFAMSGLFTQMVGGLGNIIEPANYRPAALAYGQTDPIWAAGSGTYEISSFGLTLRPEDGRVFRFALFAPPGQSMADLQSIVVNESYVLVKAK